MADTILVFNAMNASPDTVEIFYTSPANSDGTQIKAFAASNDGPDSVSYKVYIYAASGSVVNSIVPQTIVVKDKVDGGASSINHVIPAGGSLRMESSSADQLNFYVTGNVL